MTRRRLIRVVSTLVITGGCLSYILWKIDLRKTGHILGNAHVGYFFASLAIMVVTVFPMAWRWQLLLGARGLHERLDARQFGDGGVVGGDVAEPDLAMAVELVELAERDRREDVGEVRLVAGDDDVVA